ncbi:unnamed protein product [Protopolystoma xenopodis]|uniref:Uncharacterized protein n=1 Tax=Protopolystoma xenopodis TaxID=117903 RepID=A0A448WWB0_9PLAT|nr:unnamed protein product [Protopolystoma xenopodis]
MRQSPTTATASPTWRRLATTSTSTSRPGDTVRQPARATSPTPSLVCSAASEV